MEKYLKYIVFLLLAVSATGYFAIYRKTDNRIFNIYLDGEIVQTVNLDNVNESYEIHLPHNTLLVESDGISAIKADCPDKVCIKRGKMSGGAPIVCAPAKLYVGASSEEVDAVAW